MFDEMFSLMCDWLCIIARERLHSLIVLASLIVDKIEQWRKRGFSQYTDSTQRSHLSKVSSVKQDVSNYHLQAGIQSNGPHGSLMYSSMTDNTMTFYVLGLV